MLLPYKHFRPWNEFLSVEDGGSYPHPMQRVNDSFASYEAHVWRDSFSSFHEGQWHLLHEPQGHSSAAGGSAAGAERDPCGAGGEIGASAGSASASSRKPRLLTPLGQRHASRPSPPASGAACSCGSGASVSGCGNCASPFSEERRSPNLPAKPSSGPASQAAASPLPLPDAEEATTAFEVTHPGASRAVALSRVPSKTGSSLVGGHARGGSAERLEELVRPGEDPAGFFRQFCSSYAICIVVYSIVKAVLYAFFTTAGENLLGKQVNDFMGAALPFSLFPCIVSRASRPLGARQSH